MDTWCFETHPNKQLKVTTELVKVLRVIGEQVGQIVVKKKIHIDAIKIDHVHLELRDVTDHLFKDKVVKQGVVHVQIFYVNQCNAVVHTSTDIKFMIDVDIDGVESKPGIEVQNHLISIEPDVRIIRMPQDDKPGKLEIKVVAHVLFKVTEWVQRNMVTQVDCFPKTILSQPNCCCCFQPERTFTMN